MPEKTRKQPILLGIAEHSECVSASNGAIAYSCNKIRRNPNYITSLQIAVFCVLRLGWRTFGRFRSSIGTQGVLVAYTGIFTAEKKKA